MNVYFPGSFKPPHRGHFTTVEKLSKMSTVHKIYIIISKKSRSCEAVGKYEFTATQSKKLWELYINACLPAKQQAKIHVIISFFPSPLYQVYRDIERSAAKAKKESYMLIKSKKDVANKRFDMFQSLMKRGILIKTKIVAAIDNLSATDFRCLLETALQDGKWTDKEIQQLRKYLPAKFPKTEIKRKLFTIFTE